MRWLGAPGAVISAIQVRTAMQDGVLIPWRKNRPEDTTTGWELLHADRGGLHLDPRPGIHVDVFELILPASSQASSPRETSPLRPLDAPVVQAAVKPRSSRLTPTKRSGGFGSVMSVSGSISFRVHRQRR